MTTAHDDRIAGVGQRATLIGAYLTVTVATRTNLRGTKIPCTSLL